MTVTTATKQDKEADRLGAQKHGRSASEFNEGALRRLAYEHPALLLYLIGNESSSSEESRTVTMLLASLVELERRGYIDMRPAVPTSRESCAGGVWVTKKVPQVLGTGSAVDLFKCIQHAHAQVQEIINRFVKKHSNNSWSLVSTIGQGEAKAYGYIFRQDWPKTGLSGLFARFGLGEDTKTIWVQNRLKARAARQASLILKEHIDEFKRRAPHLYQGIRRDIVEGLTSQKTSSPHYTFRLPHLIKRHAH